MADQSDVEIALVTLIAGALFPNASYSPGAYQTSAAGLSTKAYRGWPEQASLMTDLNAGKAHVSIFPEQGMMRSTTRYTPEWVLTQTATPTVTVAVSGATVTLGGSITAGNVVGVQFGPSFVQAAYAYACVAGDTLATAAAALAAKIPSATSAGAVLTLPSSLGLAAATMAPQTAAIETRRQEQGFRVSCWCPTPAARDATCALIDAAVAGMMTASGFVTEFITLTPNEVGRIRLLRSYTTDMPARDRVWRRDLCYSVEYPTTLIAQQPEMLFGTTMLTTADGNVLTGTGAFQPASELLTDPSGDLWIDAAGNLLGVPPT